PDRAFQTKLSNNPHLLQRVSALLLPKNPHREAYGKLGADARLFRQHSPPIFFLHFVGGACPREPVNADRTGRASQIIEAISLPSREDGSMVLSCSSTYSGLSVFSNSLIFWDRSSAFLRSFCSIWSNSSLSSRRWQKV